MKTQLSILGLVLTGCAGSYHSKDLNIPVWTPVEYETCKLNLIAAPAADFAVTTHRYDLPYRYDNLNSQRAYIGHIDTSSKEVGAEQIHKFGEEYIQPNNWSKDGKTLYLNKVWEEPQHEMYEEYMENINMGPETNLSNVFSYSLDRAPLIDLTSVNPISFFNNAVLDVGIGLQFNALVGGQGQLYIMNYDGTNSRAFTETSGFAYGFSQSPDGTKYAYHSEYKIFIGDTATKSDMQVQTPCAFNFGPVWSPDSSRIAFYCGDNNSTADIYTANADGFGVKLLAYRNGYNGQVEFMDGLDFHHGGSDTISWTKDNKLVYTMSINGSTQLFMDNRQITFGGDENNFPQVNGDYLIYTKKLYNKRNVWQMNINTFDEKQLTNTDEHCGTRYPKWKPKGNYND